MNLVSLEYIICQGAKVHAKDGPGVLILSEFAGVNFLNNIIFKLIKI